MVAVTTVIYIAGIGLVVIVVKTHAAHWRYRHASVRAQKVGEVVLLMFFLSLVDIAGWASVYLLLGAIERMEMALYFSTVTFATLGYGDVVIDERWRLPASFEAANGIIIFGLTTAVVVGTVQRIHFADSSG